VKGHLQKIRELPNRNKIIQAIPDESPEVIEARASLDISKERKTVARAGFQPKIDLEAKYGKIATDERVFSDKDNYSVGLKLNIPLFSGFSDLNQVAAEKSLVARNEAELNKKNLAAKSDAETLYSQLVAIRERLVLEEKTLSRSEQYYNITSGEYRRGVKNSPDMVGAAERVLNSRIRNLEFRRDYQVSLLKLLGLVGAAPDDSSWWSASN
jgi:outer membrane protein